MVKNPQKNHSETQKDTVVVVLILVVLVHLPVVVIVVIHLLLDKNRHHQHPRKRELKIIEGSRSGLEEGEQPVTDGRSSQRNCVF